MRRNNIMAFLFSVLLLLPAFPANIAAAQPPAVVYTEFVSGNFNHAGDGTPASPYNLFEDALAAVADGGTIYILGGGAFINATKGNPPFQITKNITISSAPGMSAQSNLYVRMAGIVLGADVTFDNIELSFANGFRPVICANGYTLTLNNVSYSSYTRVIHLAGGGLFYADGTSASPAAGPHSRIVVTGKDSSFGNIYAGSINGSFDKAVDITVEGVTGRNIGAVYAGGAAEGYYNSENFFDINNEPEPPKVNPAAYPVRGKVSVSLNHTAISTVNGATGGTENASVSVWAQHLYSCELTNVRSLEVNAGVFVPTGMENGVNISVRQGATLDISSLTAYEANDFAGGGTLVLDDEGCFTIRGNCTGETAFKTYGGSQYHSGLAAYDHLYIKTSTGDGTFSFSPYPTQTDMTFEKRSDGWWTGAQSAAGTTVLTAFDFDASLMFAPLSQINGEEPPCFSVSAAYTEDTPFSLQYIEFVPFEYAVTYNGKTYSAPSDNIDGCYEGNIKDLNMHFYPADNTIMISNFPNTGTIAAGTYDIAITAPTATGNVTRSLQLVVTESAAAGSTETQLTLNASAQEIPDASSINLSATLTAAQQGVNAGSIALYINRQPYKTPQTPGSGGVVSWNGIMVTKENGFTTGTNRLTAVYSGTDTYAPSQEEITITVTRTDMFEISEQNGKVDVAFTNLSGKEMRNALLMIGVYRNGSLQKTAVTAGGVTINQGETQSFRFDMSGTRFDRIQGFIWDSPQTMTPLAKNAVVLLDE